jgi:hypothetical protein
VCSYAYIHDNTINKCPIGVAVKDLSEAEITTNHMSDVGEGIAAYRKKMVFGGGHVQESNNIFERVGTIYTTDTFSKIDSL